MSSADFVALALQIAAMLAVAVCCGQAMRRVKQPAVLGEMMGGILLGPTLLGAVLPGVYAWLFSSSVHVSQARDAFIKVGMLFFLFIAGLETDLSALRRMGGRAALIGLVGTVVPIAAGVGLVYALPGDFWGPVVQKHLLPFALFVGMNLANSANPVIARILMDLGLLRSEIGAMIMTATIVDDLVNWTLFAIILREVAPTSQAAAAGPPAGAAMVIVFFAVVLGLGRWFGADLLRWVKAHVSWPAGLIGVSAFFILVMGSLAEKLGIHAFLGAFLAGVAVASDDAEHNAAHEIVSHFALSFFAPLYFVSMGLSADFIANFDVRLVLVVVAAALASKVGAVLLGAWMARMPLNRDTMAIAMGLNARGATGIVLAGVGLSDGVIDQRIFVAMVVMCMVTSIIAGPAMAALLPGRVRAAAARAGQGAA